MRHEAGRLARGRSPGPAAPKPGSALSVRRPHEAGPAVFSPQTPVRMASDLISHHPSAVPDQTPQPPPLGALGVPLPGTGLGPVEKVDLLSPLLGLEGTVEPITLAADSAIAAWGEWEASGNAYCCDWNKSQESQIPGWRGATVCHGLSLPHPHKTSGCGASA